MSNSNHEESLTGLPHAPSGGGDSIIPLHVVLAAGIGATPVNAGAAALEMVDTLEGWGWLMLTASESTGLESGLAA